MQNLAVDIAIIGAGSAGMGAYRRAKALGKKVVLIEDKHYGTTCARVGCMPSKLLIAAAEVNHTIENASVFGIVEASAKVDGKKVMQRVKSERDRFVGFVVSDIEDFPKEDMIFGHAEFLSDTKLQVGADLEITAQNIIIATGSETFIPGAFQAFGDKLITNDDVFSWDDLPKSIAVFGAGVIGLELGQALARLGVRVTIFSIGGKLAAIGDSKANQIADDIFNTEYKLLADAKVIEQKVEKGMALITYVDPKSGENVTEEFELVLAATGRVPSVKGLGLENTSLKLNARGIPEFNAHTMQCKTQDDKGASIFIAGDVNNDRPLLHEASDEGFIAATNCANYPNVEAMARRTPLSVVFTEPQIGLAGQTDLAKLEEEYKANLAIGELDFRSQGRSRVMNVNKGILRLYGDKSTDKLLGATIVGPRAENLAHLLAWCIQAEMTVTQMLAMPFYHPVIEEGLRTALRNLSAEIKN